MASMSVSVSYTSITVRFSGSDITSGWGFRFDCDNGDYYDGSSRSYTFSGLEEGTSYSISGVASDENGIPRSWDSGTYTTNKRVVEATFSASVSGTSIIARWTNFQSVSYTRRLEYTLTSSGTVIDTFTDTVSPGTSGASHTFTGLENATYTVRCLVYNDSTETLVRTESVSGLIVNANEAKYYAEVDGNSITAGWKGFQGVSYDRRLEYQLYDEEGDLYSSHTATVSAGSTNHSYSFSNLPIGTYSVTCDVYNASNNTLVRTETVTGLKVEIEGVAVYIYTGSSWSLATPYIYDGSSWQVVSAHIHDGSDWRP